MPKVSSWLDRYQRRYQWAARAYDQFVQELAPEVVESLQRREQVTIVVYGATQVGKTTLILDLLGLGTSTADEVASVLRGGQALGKSATAMPIRYACSDDDFWHISGEGPLSAESARVTMAAFRHGVETGEVRDAEVLDIRIPRRLFAERHEAHRGMALNIIDIPGLDSLNHEERSWVEKLARRFVSVADLVLLVGRADSLGFLNVDDLRLEALANWQCQPSRFRIVLTFGFSPDSLRRKFEGEELSLARVRHALIEEMATHDYRFPPEFGSHLFVMEIGDSLGSLANVNPDYCQRIMKVCGEFRSELLQSISKAAGPYARLYGAFELDRVINSRVEAMKEEQERHEKLLTEECRRIMMAVADFRPDLFEAGADEVVAAIEQYDLKKVDLMRRENMLRSCFCRLEQVDWATFFEVRFEAPTSETVPALRQLLARCANIQSAASGKAAAKLVDLGLLLEGSEGDVPVVDFRRDHLMPFEAKLDGYFTESYLFSSNFRADCDCLREALGAGAKAHGKRLKSAVSAVLKKAEKRLEVEACDLKERRRLLSGVREKLGNVELKMAEVRAQQAEQMTRLRESLVIAQKFESRLNTAFLEELDSVRDEARVAPDPADRFYALLQSKLLLAEIDRMYDGRRF